jgi:hypothetical protein
MGLEGSRTDVLLIDDLDVFGAAGFRDDVFEITEYPHPTLISIIPDEGYRGRKYGVVIAGTALDYVTDFALIRGSVNIPVTVSATTSTEVHGNVDLKARDLGLYDLTATYEHL